MNRLKARMAERRLIPVAWAELGNADVAEIMVRHGWPVILIDGEHGIGDLETWVNVARAVESAGGEVILRLPDGSDTTIKKAIDRGFRSFVVPMVNSAAQARTVVASFRYPGLGSRGYAAPILRCSDWGARAGYARDEAHDEVFIMLQCEHVAAVEALDEILAVPGIGAVFVGPNDLAASAGHLERMDHPDVAALLARIEASAAKAGLPLETVRGPGRDWAELEALGYRLVAGVNDVSMLVESCHRATDELAGQRPRSRPPAIDADNIMPREELGDFRRENHDHEQTQRSHLGWRDRHTRGAARNCAILSRWAGYADRAVGRGRRHRRDGTDDRGAA